MTIILIQRTAGVLSGTLTPGAAAAGPYAVEVTTTTTGIMGSSSTTQDFTWTVTPVVDVPPTLTDPGDQTSVAGTAVSLTPTETDVDGTYPTYTAMGLPDGLNIDPDFGVISGVPTEDAIQSAPYVVMVTMDDGDGGSATQTFDWTVTDSTMTIQGDAISQQAGAGVDTFQVATFTDPDLNRQASDYTATINWGDWQTSQGEVDGSNGVYTVSGDHVYLHPGDWPIQVTVIDPAGGTATAATTASVTPAPLTVTGNLQDGAMSGLMSTFTVATFTDANGYAAAGDFTATINWGDGSATTAGVIDGADGAFRVTGAHTYAYDGTYTVGVTVTDADGATTTTTSTVIAGDIQAGLDNTLTVASFTSADPNATAASFTAMIQWGDGGIMMGGTAGTVVQEGNQFVVLGAHAFQAAGVYTVQVTVTDLSGDQLTSSDTVQAAPAPATGFGGDLTADNGYVMDAALALFTLPQGYGALGQYTATTDWGDGTNSSVSVFDNGGILEALGSHSYATMGVFAVETLLRDAAGRLVAAADSKVHAVPPPGTIRWAGPGVVPGNSTYEYQVFFPGAGIPADDINPPNLWTFTADGTTDWSVHHTFNPANGNWTGFNIKLSFPNTPEVVNPLIENLFKGDPNRAIGFVVAVVEVKVENVPRNTFVPSQWLKTNGKQTGDFLHDQVTVAGGLLVPNQDVDALVVYSAPPPDELPAALTWMAKVTLSGPNYNGTANYGVNKIQVGFHQTFHDVTDESLSQTAILRSSEEGATELDSGSDTAKPWLRLNPSPSTPNLPAIFTGGVAPRIIAADDAPRFTPIIQYGAGKFLATEVRESADFELSVAAATTDSSGSTPQLFQEAYASWSIKADGKITADVAAMTATWTPSGNAAVVPPAGNWVLDITKPVPLATQGTIANEVKPTYEFVAR